MDSSESGGVEQVDDRIRKAREILERFNDWSPHSQTGFIENYMRGKLHIGLRRVLGEQPQYGFIIHSEPSTSGWNEPLDRTPTKYRERPGTSYDGQQTAMLPHDVQLMEGPQPWVSSLIRVERFDEGAFVLGQPLYAFET